MIALEQDEVASKTELNRAKAAEAVSKANTAKQDVSQKGWAIGQQAAQQQRNNDMEEKDPKYKTRSETAHSENPKPKGRDNNVVKQQKEK